jgi:kynureninase
MQPLDQSETFARRLDSQDPLGGYRKRFYLPCHSIYLNGNSLGLLCKESEKSLKRVIQEWQKMGVQGWLEAKQPWFYYAEKLGEMASQLVGAEPNEVICSGTTTANIHSVVSTFYQPAHEKRKILADVLNFPSDIYALKGQIKMKGLNPNENLILVQSQDGNNLDEMDIVKQMDEDISLVLLSSVLFRSGQLLDLAFLTREAHKRHILIGFDCSHSVGAIPHEFSRWGIDFALWCSYKYLNSGPGSSAFLYINKKHFHKEPLMAGWFGYKKNQQFDFSLSFKPEKSAAGWQISSPGIFSAASIEGALLTTLDAGIQNIRKKSLQMTQYLIYLCDHILATPPYNFKINTPRNPKRRGGHIAIEREENTLEIYQALKSRNVVLDFRPPNTLRITPVALYNTYHEIWQVVQFIKEIIDSREYENFSPTAGVIP